MQATLPGTVVPGTLADVQPGDVVITTTSDTSLEDCRSLSTRGIGVVVLTPRTSANERARYLAAGASTFLEMNADASALAHAVDLAITETERRADVG